MADNSVAAIACGYDEKSQWEVFFCNINFRRVVKKNTDILLFYWFLDPQETLQIIQTLFRSSEHFLNHPDTFSRLSRHFLDCPDTFKIILTLFRLSRHFPDHPDTLHIIWIFCITKYPEILQPIMNLSQKLSGFAKTF